mmetsp:Transcript_2818/g.10773  ORF Transcript_2818/g.10773 Transcript_2818/m.10773 type:complete len:80 (-) Transcript_2818:5889-6128(-)
MREESVQGGDEQQWSEEVEVVVVMRIVSGKRDEVERGWCRIVVSSQRLRPTIMGMHTEISFHHSLSTIPLHEKYDDRFE